MENKRIPKEVYLPAVDSSTRSAIEAELANHALYKLREFVERCQWEALELKRPASSDQALDFSTTFQRT